MGSQNFDLNFGGANVSKKQILEGLSKEEVLSEVQLQELLAQQYLEAANAITPIIYKNAANFSSARAEAFSADFAGAVIWRKLLAFLCRVLSAASSTEDILEAIMKFLSTFLPGGALLEHVVSKVLKYFIDRGYAGLCPAT